MVSGGGAIFQRGMYYEPVSFGDLSSPLANLSFFVFRRDLGSPGQKVQLYALNVFCGQDARGVTKEYFINKKASGNYSMSWVSIAEWVLA